ncbi:MAG: hypothetical protein AB1896_15545 [Thermodesulfobacteriota bacterium]
MRKVLGVAFIIGLGVMLVLVLAGRPVGAQQPELALINPDAPDVFQVLALSDGRVLALTDAQAGLFYLPDQGGKWRRAKGLPEVFLCFAAADSRGRVYLATSQGLFRSEDGFDRWANVASQSAARLAFSPDGAAALVKVWGQGLFAVRPEDLGPEGFEAEEKRRSEAAALLDEAERLEAELLGADTQSLTPAETEEYLKKYETWKKLTEEAEALEKKGTGWPAAGRGLPEGPAQALACDEHGRWYAGFFGAGVYQSRDLGSGWREINRGLAGRQVLVLAAGPGGEVLAGTYGGGLFRWFEKRGEWSPVGPPGLAGRIIQTAAFGPRGEALAGTREDGLYYSTDGLDAWRKAESLPGPNVPAAAVGRAGTLWAAVSGRGLFGSTDQGRTWRAAELGE